MEVHQFHRMHADPPQNNSELWREASWLVVATTSLMQYRDYENSANYVDLMLRYAQLTFESDFRYGLYEDRADIKFSL